MIKNFNIGHVSRTSTCMHINLYFYTAVYSMCQFVYIHECTKAIVKALEIKYVHACNGV